MTPKLLARSAFPHGNRGFVGLPPAPVCNLLAIAAGKSKNEAAQIRSVLLKVCYEFRPFVIACTIGH